MQLWNRALLYFIQKKEQPIIGWVVDVETVRGNNFIVDNKNKTVTVYKKYAANGTTLYNLDFLPIVKEGYEPVKPDEGITLLSNGYWRQTATGKDGNVYEYTFDIINSSTKKVAATYKLILDWTTTGEV